MTPDPGTTVVPAKAGTQWLPPKDARFPLSRERHRFSRVFAAAWFALAAPLTSAQSAKNADPPAPPLPAEFTDEARRAYAQGLGDARKLVEAKRYDEALAKLEGLSQSRPREARARFMKAGVQADMGRAQDAVATLRALVADFPELPEPHNNLAVIYAAQGNYALAKEELELAIATAPDYAIAHANLGDVYLRLAIGAYEKASAADKTNRELPQKLKAVREILAVPAR